MPYAIYLRKSRADVEAEATGAGETLARHKSLLLQLAKTQSLPIIAIYEEIVSGESIESRPEMKRLLTDVEQHKYDGVLVMEIERLARGDTVDQGMVARTFLISKTKIITPKKIYDPESEFDNEYFEFELFMSRREYKTISRRIQTGRIASVKEGHFVSSVPPYGYNKIKVVNGKGYTLSPNDEADTVKLIYELYLSGMGKSAVAKKLDELRIKPRNRDIWSKATVSDILKNPVYTGKIRWAYRPDVKQSVNGLVQKKRIKNTDCILVDGLHSAIISQDDFDKVQEMMKINRHVPLREDLELKNPLTGLIYCKKCGAIMTRLGPNAHCPHDTLKCSNRYCSNVSAALFVIERKLIEQLQEWLNQYKVNIAEASPKKAESSHFEKASKNMKDELSKLDLQMSKLYDLLEQGIYTTEVFTERSAVLAEKKTKLIKDIGVLENQFKKEKNIKDIKSIFIPTVQKIIDSYFELPNAKVKNDLLKSVIRRIEYEKEAPNRRGQLEKASFELDVFPILQD
ncbi:MAG TPA: recombinase family protein [Oscillospiraceae bacterium]|nr:recombinase family protein [Oscillospiraceae bacterium]